MRSSALILLLLALPAAAEQAPRLGLGTPATPEQIQSWDIDARPDGQGLPPGQGSVAAGATLYAERCAACHGADGRTGALTPALRLAGGEGSLTTPRPVQTVGSYWPYASTLFDYVRRAMPFDAPQSLTAEQVYAVSGYVLHLNGLLPADAVVDAGTLTALRMPNRGRFRPTVETGP